MATDETGFNDVFAKELILELEAFLHGALVRCYYCTDFVPLELSRQESVKFAGDEQHTELHICNECWLERQICDFCESEEQDGEIVQVSTKPRNFYDAWVCNACLES